MCEDNSDRSNLIELYPLPDKSIAYMVLVVNHSSILTLLVVIQAFISAILPNDFRLICVPVAFISGF